MGKPPGGDRNPGGYARFRRSVKRLGYGPRVARCLLLTLAAALAACAPKEDTNQLARQYVELAFALGEHDPLYLDHVFGLARDSGPLPLESIGRRAARLLRRLEEPDSRRERRLADGVRALLARVDRLRGVSRPVAEEMELVFGLRFRPHPRDAETLARLHAEVDRNLPGIAPLPVRIRRRSERLAEGRPEALLREALAFCGANFDRKLSPLRLHWMSPAEWRETPTGPTPFYRHDGDEGVLSLPEGLPLGPPEARRLACHEGSPGHHFQAELAAAAYRETGLPELGIIPLHHPRTAVFEGLAAAAEQLGAPPAPEAVLEPVALAILAGYLDGQLSRLDAFRALMFEALVPDPHGVLDHADRFGSYALARPAADPEFAAAVAEVFRNPTEERLSRAVLEAMSPAEMIGLFPG